MPPVVNYFCTEDSLNHSVVNFTVAWNEFISCKKISNFFFHRVAKRQECRKYISTSWYACSLCNSKDLFLTSPFKISSHTMGAVLVPIPVLRTCKQCWSSKVKLFFVSINDIELIMSPVGGERTSQVSKAFLDATNPWSWGIYIYIYREETYKLSGGIYVLYTP